MNHYHLSFGLGLESIRVATEVVSQFAVVGQELNVSTVGLDLSFLAQLDVLLTTERGESPVLAYNDLLASRELVLRTTESLDGMSTILECFVSIVFFQQRKKGWFSTYWRHEFGRTR